MESQTPRQRTRLASVAVAVDHADALAATTPRASKRARRQSIDHGYTETTGVGASVANADAHESLSASGSPSPSQSQSPSLVQRLMTEVALCSWRLSREQTVAHLEGMLNDQLEQVAVFSRERQSLREREMTYERCRLSLAPLVAMAGLDGDADGEQGQEQDLDAMVTLPRADIEKHVRDSMDVVSWLLVLRQEETARQNATMEAMRVLEATVERKQLTNDNLRNEVEGLRQQLASQENIFHGREQALVTERKALLSDKKYLEVTCAKLQGQETAYKAQLRRKDADYERLRKSLQDVVLRSAKEKRGMSQASTLNDAVARKNTAARQVTESHETLITKQLIDNLEQKRDELLFENEALAKQFETLQKQVESVSSQNKKTIQLFLAQRGGEGNTKETEQLAHLPIDDFTPAPLHLGVKSNVSEYINSTLEKLMSRVDLFERAIKAELEYAASHRSDDVIAALRKKIDDAQSIIAEQDQLLQASLVNGPAPALTERQRRGGRDDGHRRRLEYSIVEQLTNDLEAEWQDVRRKSRNIDRERVQLQDQGMKLDQDRAAFEMRSFEHFFGIVESGDIVMHDVDTPATPRTVAILKNIGISASSFGSA